MNDPKNTCGETNRFEKSSPTPPMLIGEIARLFHAQMRSYETDSIMTQESVRLILRELGHCDGCSQLDLVHKTHLKPPTVSVTLTKLEENGLVVRRRDEMDQRMIRVYLSPKGQEHHHLVHKRLHTVDQLLMQGFDKEETEQLVQFLVRMRNNILSSKTEINSLQSLEKLSKENP